MPPLPVVLIGAGYRGATAYASYALRRPEEMRVVAIAEPVDRRRAHVADKHSIPHKRAFRTWEDLLDRPQMGEIALICTPDNLHLAPAREAMRRGYHVMIEVPVAPDAAACRELVRVAKETNRLLLVAHVLRYTAFYRAVQRIARSERLGQIINYSQNHTLTFWQSAHSFVRHPDHQSQQNPMLFSVGLHNLDLILWLLQESVSSLSSGGSLYAFTPEKAPAPDAPKRCIDECPVETECPFSAVGMYLERRFKGLPPSGWPYNILAEGDESPGAMVNALENTPWGHCVYHNNSTMVNHQSILMESKSGIEVSLTIGGHSQRETHTIRINGSKGSLFAENIGVDSHITVYDNATQRENTLNFRLSADGHGSGDHGLMGTMVKNLRDEAEVLTDAASVIDAHLLAFAAEEARLSRKVVKFNNNDHTKTD